MRWFNVSELENFKTCPQFHHNLWVEKRRLSTETSEARVLGIWAHKQLEGLMHLKPLDLDWPPVKGAEALHAALKHWETIHGPTGRVPWDRVMMTETALRASFGAWAPDTGLFGTPDAFVIKDGILWHVQHKTLGASTPVHVFVAGIAVSWHESVYRWLAIENGLATEASYGGTMVNVIRKLGLKRIQEEPDSALHIEFVSITPERVRQNLSDIARLVKRMEGLDERPERDPNACTGRFGNKLCGYYDVCWRGIRLDSALYETADPLERYSAGSGISEGEGE